MAVVAKDMVCKPLECDQGPRQPKGHDPKLE